ncbi:coadhesin-like isoform X2 [Mercenaria mercenaria]|nr:coadhesin-like isoform X2 [Mercenaria mercenaria]
MDCITLDKLFDICDDIHDAKTVCRNFCNLCSLVDGNWAEWSPWSVCDVTCGQGKYTRIRTCTDPAPANQGLDCEGNATDTKPCVKPLCPVHGEWSDWSNWGSCPITCGIGIQKRFRNCSNPYPLRYGEHCFGNTIDMRICIRKTCDDAGWTHWDSWSTCSLTCGGGMQSRSRTCTKPRPSVFGHNCIGNPRETQICNSKRCPPIVSAFSVDKPHTYSKFNGIDKLTFSHFIYQQGGDFSLATGTFKCSKPGVYHFIVTLVKKRSSTRVDQVSCNMYKDRSLVIIIRVDPTDDDTDKGSAAITESVIIHLNKGDTVFLSDCKHPPSTYMEYWTSFTGFLLYPDS